MLLHDKEQQELISREKKDRRDFEQIAALASKMGLHRWYPVFLDIFHLVFLLILFLFILAAIPMRKLLFLARFRFQTTDLIWMTSVRRGRYFLLLLFTEFRSHLSNVVLARKLKQCRY